MFWERISIFSLHIRFWKGAREGGVNQTCLKKIIDPGIFSYFQIPLGPVLVSSAEGPEKKIGPLWNITLKNSIQVFRVFKYLVAVY